MRAGHPLSSYRERRHRLLLRLCNLPCPLSNPWRLFGIVCFVIPPLPPTLYPGFVSFIRKRPPNFSVQKSGQDRCKQLIYFSILLNFGLIMHIRNSTQTRRSKVDVIYSKQRRIRTSWQKLATLILKNTRTCLAKQDRAGSCMWSQLKCA